MQETALKWISLKTKMTLMVSLLVTAILSFSALLAATYFEQEFRSTIENHQFSMISAMANEIDGKIMAVQGNMEAIAQKFEPAVLADAAAAEDFLRSQNAALLFDNGLFLLSAQGKLLAGTAAEPSLLGRDYSFREYFQVTLRARKPHISRPFLSSQEHGHPVVVFTVPVLSDGGRMVAMLAGSLDLLGENFLGQLAAARVGEGGYFYLFGSDRTLFIHPERDRILHHKVPLSADRLLARMDHGLGGNGQFCGSAGLHLLQATGRRRLDSSRRLSPGGSLGSGGEGPALFLGGTSADSRHCNMARTVVHAPPDRPLVAHDPAGLRPRRGEMRTVFSGHFNARRDWPVGQGVQQPGGRKGAAEAHD